jgi:hypothetical protein
MNRIIEKLSGKKNKINLPVKFHTDAFDLPEHGTIYVNNKTKRLSNEPVRFSFVGAAVPPKLDQNVFNYIWTQAKKQGYEPIHLRTYATVYPASMNVVPKVRMREEKPETRDEDVTAYDPIRGRVVETQRNLHRV